MFRSGQALSYNMKILLPETPYGLFVYGKTQFRCSLKKRIIALIISLFLAKNVAQKLRTP